VPASADGDCGGAFVGQIAHTLQAANGAARLRRAHIFERDAEGHYVEPLWCSARLGEVFVGNHRADSHADACAKDAAILASIALQFGAPPNVLRNTLLRDSQGRPCYRDGKPVLTVRSIGEGANLEVNDRGNGFRPYRGSDAASPVRKNGQAGGVGHQGQSQCASGAGRQ
jgi:hypothetical protein